METKKESWFDSLASTLQKPGEPTAPKSKSLAELLQQDFASYFETHGYGVMQEYQSRSRWSASRPATNMGARSGRFTSTDKTLPRPFSLRERLEDIWDEADAKAGVKKEARSNRSRRKPETAELGTLYGVSADFVIVDELVTHHAQVDVRTLLAADFSAIEARLLAHMQCVVKPSLVVSTLAQEDEKEVRKGASNECGQKQQQNTTGTGRGDAAHGGDGQAENPDGRPPESGA